MAIMNQKPEIQFQLSVSGRDDGTIEAIYIQFNSNKVAKTVVHLEDILMADYDAAGHVVGIEILAPVKMSKIVSLVDTSARSSFRKFIKKAAPEELICA